MYRTILRRVALATAIAALPMSNAFAHCFVLPTITYVPTPGTPAGKEVDIEGDISKRITADFGVTIAETWTEVRTPGAPTMGASTI